MQIRCLKCKGRGFCGRSFCPLIAKSQTAVRVKKDLGKEDFYGSAPTPFVGRYGYPNINVGILSLQDKTEDAWLYDAPRHWSKENFDIPKIANFRSELINSRFKADIKDRTKLLEISQEVGMASKPVDVEVNLDAKPTFRLSTDPYTAPMGPNAKLKKVAITSNPKIPHKVDKVVSDTDLKATDAISYLYDNDFDENFLTKLLSIGTLGVNKNRKLVPTRWSITATDDMIAKKLTPQVHQFPEIDYTAFFGSYLGNYYLLLAFPEPWSYELFETYLPKASWNTSNEVQYMTDYEGYNGRKTYADNCAGGYYSVRMAILEKLYKIKRQASVLALRFITGEYAMPLGVWVTREATRKSLQNSIRFSSRELMIKYARNLLKKKFNFDLDKLLNKSILLKNIKNQRKLTSFM
ncbi:hypothetical protein ACFLZ6_01800 [Nanoarchaeota archaeon]